MDMEEINYCMYVSEDETVLFKIEEYEKKNRLIINNDILYSAVLARRYYIVKALLHKGYNTNSYDKHNNYPIHMISSSLYLSIPQFFSSYCKYCKELLACKKYLNLSKSTKVLLIKYIMLSGKNIADDNLLCLSDTVRSEEIRILKLLLDYGADINVVNGYGFTALHDSVKDNNLEISKLLLSRGINTHIKSNTGITAFAYAAQSKNINILKCILDYYDGYKYYDYDSIALSKAIYSKDVNRMVILLELGLNIDLINDLGSTALHVAIEHRSYSITKLLLKKGADPNAEDQYGRTPIYMACTNNKLVSILLRYGARVIVIDKYGYTPIDMLNSESKSCTRTKDVFDSSPSVKNEPRTDCVLLSAHLIIARLVLDACQYPEIENTNVYLSCIKSIISSNLLENILKECQIEIEKIKSTKILDYTLDVFLLNNINIDIYRNSNIITLLESILILFPNYGIYINKNIIDCKKRLSLIDKK
ncbi:SWPV1-207 [Shearwaterpox virus]|uniref:SWPV1-207 n=1 Tax=Shearwaterpox virus TaxID=1974596 RepID=A0A1V0S822_CNPV|nr:SWPV1-207 [Shearwaterpox virus]